MRFPENPLRFPDVSAWRGWLSVHHADQKEAWLAIKKSRVAKPGIEYKEAVEEAVCFGWIDGIMKSVDAEIYILRFSPRRRGAIWSASNRERVERLVEQGRMTAAGMEVVREAMENGEWEAALRREDVSNLPDDLSAALAENGKAQANFEKLSPSQKKQFLFWIHQAKRVETRQRRIQKTVEMVQKGQRFG
jgi:uncharacterized protein YdeI (YjbR/CyaY-like superfamily)